MHVLHVGGVGGFWREREKDCDELHARLSGLSGSEGGDGVWGTLLVRFMVTAEIVYGNGVMQ